MKALAEAFADLSKLLKKFDKMEPNTSLIERNFHGALSAYKQIYDGKKKTKQANIDVLLKRVTPPQFPPRGIPKEGVALLGDDSSVHLTAPEDLPVEEDVEVGTVALTVLTLRRPGLMCMFMF